MFEIFNLRTLGRLIVAAVAFQFAAAMFHQAENTLTAGQSMIAHLGGADSFRPTGMPGY